MKRIPYPVLFPLIILFCLVGVYSLNNRFTLPIFTSVREKTIERIPQEQD